MSYFFNDILKNFFENSVEILDNMLVYARDNGIKINEKVKVSLFYFSSFYGEDINLINIDREAIESSKKKLGIKIEEIFFNSQGNKVVNEEKKKLIKKEIMRAINSSMFKCLELSKFGIELKSLFSKEGMEDYVELREDSCGKKFIRADWDRIVKDYTDKIEGYKEFRVIIKIRIDKEIEKEYELDNNVGLDKERYIVKDGRVEIKIVWKCFKNS